MNSQLGSRHSKPSSGRRGFTAFAIDGLAVRDSVLQVRDGGHLDRGYDYSKTRHQLASLGLDDLNTQHREAKGVTERRPLELGLRWVVEGTNS